MLQVSSEPVLKYTHRFREVDFLCDMENMNASVIAWAKGMDPNII